jgi:hypothetical protein
VTAVGAYSGGVTLVTVYGGTDYDLANAAITSPYYSHVKSPFGFPQNPDKWTVQASDSSNQTQATPTQDVWYNLGSFSISVPIGAWKLGYHASISGIDTSSTMATVWSTLSTANNSASDSDFILYQAVVGLTGASNYVFGSAFTEKNIILAAKTTYYLNTKTSITGMDSINNYGSSHFPTIIKAVCAYL